MFTWLFIFLCWLACADQSWAASAPVLEIHSSEFSDVNLQDYTLVSVDPAEKSFQKLTSSPSFESFQNERNADLRGMFEGTAIFYFSVINKTEEDLSVVLYTNNFFYPIHFYAMEEGQLKLLGHSDENLGSIPMDLDHIKINQILTLPKGAKKEIFIKARRKDAFQASSFRLASTKTFAHTVTLEMSLVQISFGICIMVFLTSFFFWLQFRRMYQFVYLSYTLAISLLLSFGYDLVHAWSPAYVLREQRFLIWSIFYDLTILLGLVFTVTYLNIYQWSKKLAVIFTAMAILFFLNMLTAYHYPLFNFHFRAYVSLVFGPLVILAGSLGIRNKIERAPLFLLGWSILILGSVITMFQNFLDITTFRFIPYIGLISSVLEMIILTFAVSESLRREAHNYEADILKLNADLIHNNQKLQKSLTILSHETQSRITMVEDLAHRGNNPLHAAQLSLNNIELDIDSINSLLKELFGPIDQLDADGLTCYQSLQSNLHAIQSESGNTRLNLLRMSDAIRDMRLLSGVDGLAHEWFDINDIWPRVISRLKENVGEAKQRRLEIIGDLSKAPNVLGQGRVLVICFERWCRTLLELSADSIALESTIERRAGDVDWCLSGIPAELSQEESLQKLTATLAHLLTPYQMQFYLAENGLHINLLTEEPRSIVS